MAACGSPSHMHAWSTCYADDNKEDGHTTGTAILFHACLLRAQRAARTVGRGCCPFGPDVPRPWTLSAWKWIHGRSHVGERAPRGCVFVRCVTHACVGLRCGAPVVRSTHTHTSSSLRPVASVSHHLCLILLTTNPADLPGTSLTRQHAAAGTRRHAGARPTRSTTLGCGGCAAPAPPRTPPQRRAAPPRATCRTPPPASSGVISMVSLEINSTAGFTAELCMCTSCAACDGLSRRRCSLKAWS